MNKRRREDYEHTNYTGGATLSMSPIKDSRLEFQQVLWLGSVEYRRRSGPYLRTA